MSSRNRALQLRRSDPVLQKVLFDLHHRMNSTVICSNQEMLASRDASLTDDDCKQIYTGMVVAAGTSVIWRIGLIVSQQQTH